MLLRSRGRPREMHKKRLPERVNQNNLTVEYECSSERSRWWHRVFIKNCFFFSNHCNPSTAWRRATHLIWDLNVQSLLLAGQPIAAQCWRGRDGKILKILEKNTIFNEHFVHWCMSPFLDGFYRKRYQKNLFSHIWRYEIEKGMTTWDLMERN